MLIGWLPWYIRAKREWQNIYFYCSIYIGNQFIIAIWHLGGLWYMANIPRLRAVSRHSALCRAEGQSLAVEYWPYTTPHRALLLNYNTDESTHPQRKPRGTKNDNVEIVMIVVRIIGPRCSVIWLPHIYLVQRAKNNKERTKREVNEVLTGN